MEQLKHIEKETANGAQFNLDALYKIAPSCFTEAKGVDGELHHVVDFTKLRQLLGDDAVEDAPEVYDFTWVGKRAAQREAMAPCRKTLRPCPEESVDWDNTQNLYIEGDNLEVLKLLQNSYMGKVKMIYIDPPYNTGNDFVYHDDFHRTQREEDEAAGVINEEGERMVKNTESNGKFHSDWCSMIYSRLMVARSLLTDDGVIFISIDDNEVENLRKVCDETFGELNFLGAIAWRRFNSQANVGMFATVKDTILIYSKNIKLVSFGRVPLSETAKKEYQYRDERGVYARRPCIDSVRGHYKYDIICPNGNVLRDNWTIKEDEFRRLDNENLIHWPANGGNPMQKIYLSDAIQKGQIACDFWGSEYGNNKISVEEIKTLFGFRSFDFPKPTLLLYNLLSLGASERDSLIVDFFSGSATTAHAVMQKNAEDGGNRKFIMVQWPEETDEKSEAYKAGYKNICEIGKERIRRAGKKIKEEHPEAKDLDIGFRVFKCDESNYKEVAFAPKDYDQAQLDLFVDNIKDDRTDLDLLFDCMLRWGVTLDLPMTKTKVDGCTIHNVNEGGLVACFDGKVTERVIDAIAEMYPVKVVFRDSSFEEDAQKMNLFELFKQKCGWTEQEVRNNVKVI